MAAQKVVRKYVRFTEWNDHEGERWHRFIDMNDPNLPVLESIVNSLSGEEDCPYKFKRDESGELALYSEESVNMIIESFDDDCGYMDAYDRAEVKEDLQDKVPSGKDSFEFFDSQIYKMQWAK
ncbi:hypothetical protein [Vibrio sp. D431a]|uniref:hypothetical protein n=1 Tax=Vibrio sp. D431a TaxID=2837388 RepID=UPI0025548C63|nr:hypothetical protein [Vibrio sp. D431a]MDK9790000.1 hypothetical protein [Vibrio sp. D431a]